VSDIYKKVEEVLCRHRIQCGIWWVQRTVIFVSVFASFVYLCHICLRSGIRLWLSLLNHID